MVEPLADDPEPELLQPAATSEIVAASAAAAITRFLISDSFVS
jgi:hypothetical protein